MRDPYARSSDESVDIVQYGAVLRRQLPLIAAAVTIGLVLALLYTWTKTPLYTATTEVLIQPPSTANPGLPIGSLISLDTEVRLVSSAPIAQLARDSLDSTRTVTQLLDHVSVESSTDTYVLDVMFTDVNAKDAARGADAFAQAYLDYKSVQAQKEITARYSAIEQQLRDLRTRERELRTIIDGGIAGTPEVLDAQDELDDLQVQFGVLAAQQANIPTYVSAGDIILPASPPRSPSSPNLILNLLAGSFLGLFIGIIIAFLRDRADDRIRGRGDLPSNMQTPVLGYVPRVDRRSREAAKRLFVEEEPRGAVAEAFRSIRTSVMAIGRHRDVKVIAIVSSGEQEGKSTTAANLAATIAHADQRVVVVGVDLRRPRLHDLFGLSNDFGLSDLLLGQIELKKVLVRTDVPDLSVIPGGPVPVNPAELLQSSAMVTLIDDLRQDFDYVILDCPPILGLSDCLAVVPLADATIMVVEAERTRAGAIADAIEQLDHVGVGIEGLILNAVRVGRSGRAHHAYGYFLASPQHLGTRPEERPEERPETDPQIATLDDRRQDGKNDAPARPHELSRRRAAGSLDDDD